MSFSQKNSLKEVTLASRIHALISDFDGTLVQSEHLWPDLDRNYFTSVLGRERWEDWEPRFAILKKTGLPMGGIMERLIQTYGLSKSAEEMKRGREDLLLATYRQHLQPHDGALELLDFIRANGLKLAIASGMSLRMLEGALAILGWRDRVHVIASTHELGHGKPSPSVFLLAAARLGFAPSECFVLENDENGMKAAQSSGMPFVVIPDTETRRETCRAANLPCASNLRAVLAMLETF
ncbi:HAD family phosphatase [Patescibacteria group bacterium]|nr:HAD family phosphatase [Patescibacteria group bacterium]